MIRKEIEDWAKWLYMHEYGHYLDSQKFGLTYLLAVGLPSLFNQIKSDNKGTITEWNGEPVENPDQLNLHDVYWTEIRASKNAAEYFKKYGVDWSGWKFDDYPLKLQKRQSMTINRNDKSTSISTQMDSLIPQSKISTLTQGMFVGAIADNFDERIEQKIFHAEIVVDNTRVDTETKAYKEIPIITDFVDENGVNKMKEQIQLNYNRIKEEAKQIVADELERIRNDENLRYLLPKEE